MNLKVVRAGVLALCLVVLPSVMSISAQNTNTGTTRVETKTEQQRTNDFDWGWLGLLGLLGLAGLLKSPKPATHVEVRRDDDVNRRDTVNRP